MRVAKSPDWDEDNEKTYDDLIVAVEASDGVLSLLLAVCDELHLRSQIIQRYGAELQSRIQPYQVVLLRKEPSLRQAIAEIVKDEPYLQSGGRAVITVTGAEQLLTSRLGEERSEQEIFFGYLQWTREGLRDFPYPIILWLTNQLLTELSRKAPDFWSWRKDVFRFRSSVPQNLDDTRIQFSFSIQQKNSLFLEYKRLLPPEEIEDDSIPLEDLQQLILQTEQQSGNTLNNPLLATLYSRMGISYASQIKLDEIEASQISIEQATKWFQKAIGIQESLEIIIDLAKNLAWLGYLYELQGNYAEAESLLIQALTILKRELGFNHSFVTRTLHNLSVSYVLQGRYAEARSLAQQVSLNIPSNLPYIGVLQFIGREKELEQLHRQLQNSDRMVISTLVGMGGIGKTELAIQYALRYQNDYLGGLCWLQCRGADLGTQIVNYGRSLLSLAIPDGLALLEQVSYCWSHWREGTVLVIYDDVIDYDAIASYLPPPNKSQFKVLMTSRQKTGANFKSINLDVLDEESALELLRSLVTDGRIEEQFEQAKELCRELGYLPLALELAARYLDHRRELSLEELLHQLQMKQLEAKALTYPEVGMTAARSVKAAFELSWQELSAEAKELGCRLSLFAPAQINWSWVEECIIKTGDEEERKEAQEELEELRNQELIDRNLLQINKENEYRLHPLNREFFITKQEDIENIDEYKRDLCRVMEAIAKQIPLTVTLDVIASITPAIPHLREVSEELIDWVEDEDVIWLNEGLGRFYEGQSAYREAEKYYIQSVKVTRSRLGENHPSVAASYNNLAHLYQAMGRYREAEPLYIEALTLYKDLLGENHPHVAASLHNLAGLYGDQGRYSEAEPLLKKALALYKDLLGENHPHVAASLHNLAGLYRDQGRYSEAEPMYRKALEIRLEQLGDNHPNVAQSYNNLALLYSSIGRYAEAELMYRKALEILLEQLGDIHPDVASSYNNLALLYSSMGRYAETIAHYQKALNIAMQTLGEEHPKTRTIYNNYMTTLRESPEKEILNVLPEKMHEFYRQMRMAKYGDRPAII